MLGVILMAVALSAAMAGPLDEATAAYARGDRATMLHLLSTVTDRDVDGAQSLLGKAFPTCKVDVPNYAEVVAVFRRGAEQGNPRAQFNLGNAYFFGSGVPRDHAQAANWYRLAAEQGEASALHNLGYLYEHGKGVPQDKVQAFMWLSLFSSRHAFADSKDAADKSLDTLAAEMTPSEIGEAQRLVREWRPVSERR